MGTKILIADDEPHLRMLVRSTLETTERTIVEAEDGQAALDGARVEDPDLVILDWTMPGLDGIEVLRALREEGSHVAVIMLTARSEKAARTEAVSLGVRGFLIKPFSPMQLLELVDKVLADLP